MLGRYLASGVCRRGLLALLLLIVIFSAIDIVETRALADAPSKDFFYWYLYKLPSIVGILLPMALTLGVQLMIAYLKESGEWAAMSAAGISPIKTMARMMSAILAIGILAIPLYSHISPMALTVWESRLTSQVREMGEYARWQKQGDRLVQIDNARDTVTVIERFKDGRPNGRWRYRLSTGEAKGQGWQWNKGLYPVETKEAVKANLSDQGPLAISAKPRGTLLAGASLTWTALEEHIQKVKTAGYPATPFEAEKALRIVLMLGCLILPLGCALITLRIEEQRASRLTGLAVIGAALYWFITATLWNGAQMGTWSSIWLAAGAPLIFMGVILVGHVGLTVKRNRL